VKPLIKTGIVKLGVGLERTLIAGYVKLINTLKISVNNAKINIMIPSLFLYLI
jgi:hypothetical protein